MLGTTGRRFVVVRPTLADVVLKMPRGAQVIYPKDLGRHPARGRHRSGHAGARGRGGLGGPVHGPAPGRAPTWSGTSCARTSPTGRARTWRPWSGEGAPYQVELRDVYEGIDETGLDRIVLDLPEPWQVLPHAEKALRPGGILCAYLPTINQTAQLRTALEDSAVRDGRDPRGPAPDLARRSPLGEARPPHGRPHRLPDHGPVAGSTGRHRACRDGNPHRRSSRTA